MGVHCLEKSPQYTRFILNNQQPDSEMFTVSVTLLLLFCYSTAQEVENQELTSPDTVTNTLMDTRYNITEVVDNNDSIIEIKQMEETIPETTPETAPIFTTVQSTTQEEKTTILFSNFYTLPPERPEQIEEYDQEYEKETNRYLEDHPCKRNCLNATSTVCNYRFVLEHYHTMSKACHNCPHNLSHCYFKDCVAGDGVERTILTINRKFPGPLIEVCEGDEVIVDVENHLKDGTTSIHWHGIQQKYTPYMDGVPFVTQCPIMPMTTFRYQIRPNPGTHFWHSHIGLQRGEGVYGPLIVKKRSDIYAPLYDMDLSEHIIVVQDWIHKPGESAFAKHYHSNGKNKADTLLINGRGQFQEFVDDNGRLVYTPFSSFTVKKGLKYRFRLINSGILNCPIEMKIDNHTILAISSDGQDIQLVKVDSLISYAGERWDFILEASAPVGNYWIRFRGLMDCDERFKAAHSASILHYEDANLKKPSETLSYEAAKGQGKVLNPFNVDCKGLLCMNNLFKSKFLERKDVNKEPDQKFIFSYDFHPLDNPKYHKTPEYGFSKVKTDRAVYTPQLNHISLSLPSFPLLSQYYDIKPEMLCENQLTFNCNSEYCECTNVVNVNLGDLVEVILIDLGVTYDANHPFHLHGHYFDIVAVEKVGKNTTVQQIEELDAKGMIKRNLINPVTKDTVNVPDGGYTIIRFYADNPGYWLFHCHLEWHSELGMGLVFKVGQHSEFPPVPRGFPKCGNYMPSEEMSNNPETSENEVIYEIHANEIPRFVKNTSFDNTQNIFTKWWRRNSSTLVKQSVLNVISLLLISLTFY
ncbi:laccase-1-like isoform X1 [Cimex lectularius]|uniref:Multicopper oxidase n=2 Tax=Cimex lectularius TaxID=79782 RepID=A0A8I6S416_CIMLE|nr:laccase-1-like isoform X1 [Cimex lectularius]